VVTELYEGVVYVFEGKETSGEVIMEWRLKWLEWL
jgi:hypothetical protein